MARLVGARTRRADRPKTVGDADRLATLSRAYQVAASPGKASPMELVVTERSLFRTRCGKPPFFSTRIVSKQPGMQNGGISLVTLRLDAPCRGPRVSFQEPSNRLNQPPNLFACPSLVFATLSSTGAALSVARIGCTASHSSSRTCMTPNPTKRGSGSAKQKSTEPERSMPDLHFVMILPVA